MKGAKSLRQIRQSILALCVAVVLACGMSVPAFADATAANVDLGAKGSISATLETSDGTHVEDGTLSLYKVADLVLVNGNMTYTYTSAFDGCEASLDDVSVASLATELDTYVSEHNISANATCVISTDGTVSFTELSVGLYLIVQTGASTGYTSIDPFLVSIPLDVDDAWVYDVNASPKIEPATPEPDNPDNPNPDNPNPDNPNDNPDNPNDNPGTTTGTTTPGSTGGTTGTGTGTTGSSGSTGSNTGSNTPSNTASASTLPQTGQLNWPIPVLCAAGVVCVVVGIVLNRTTRKKNTHAA